MSAAVHPDMPRPPRITDLGDGTGRCECGRYVVRSPEGDWLHPVGFCAKGVGE